MKSLFISLLAFFCFGTYAQEFSFIHDGYDRPYLVHLPDGYDSNQSYPLIVAFHGGLGKGSQLENQSLLSDKSDAEGFIVVYPDGVPFGVLKIRTWNAGHCCGEALNNNVDDVGFVLELLDTLKKNYNISENEVYGTGMSNGAFLCYRIACEHPDAFNAIAPVAGTMAIDECNAENLVPIIHFQSALDDNIPYQGGVGNGLSTQHNPPLDSVHTVWSNKGNCDGSNFSSNVQYTHKIYDNCDCNKTIEYYLTMDGGHSWPGGTKALGDDPSTFINANDLMWEFFQSVPTECPTSNSNELLIVTNFSVWPNPVNNILQLSFSAKKVEVFDLTGRLQFISNGSSIDVSLLSSGIYIIEVEGLSSQFVKK